MNACFMIMLTDSNVSFFQFVLFHDHEIWAGPIGSRGYVVIPGNVSDVIT